MDRSAHEPISPDGLNLEEPRVDESALLERLRAGDAAAFEMVVREYSVRMLMVARRFLASESDAADAVQDAWLSAFRGIAKFDGKAKLSTWLHRIVVNASLMKIRAKQRRPESSMEDLMPRFGTQGDHTDAVIDWSGEEAPSSWSEREELRAKVRACIDELPESFRTVILLRDIEGFDTDATAQLLGLTPGATKAKLHRARQALRTLLDRSIAHEATDDGISSATPATLAEKGGHNP